MMSFILKLVAKSGGWFRIFSQVHIFGYWKKLEYPENNPKEHRENIQTPHGKKEDVKSAADW